jgi:7-carboxy-7-deazaguanine synthase
MDHVTVKEYFVSIQGESTHAGMPCFFVRLAGCNLRCPYCDTTEAFQGGETMTVAALVEAWRASPAAIAEITGGEPLLQLGFEALALGLRDAERGQVLVETNGTQDIGRIPERVSAVMDVKTPASGSAGSFLLQNLDKLRPYDEVKFVICDRGDYEWSREFAETHHLASRCRAILFSPVDAVDGKTLGEWVIADGLPVRLQVQLHKTVGMK